jgi:hypothetical protein
MARISTYPLDENVVGADKWIGTDSQDSKKTKNFTVNSVAEYLNTRDIIESQTLKYEYQNVLPGETRKPETISFYTSLGDNVSFSSISTWMISKYAKPYKLVETFYESPLIGRQILITDSENPSNWAIYSWESSVQNINEPNFYDINVTLIDSTGYLINEKNYLISLLGNTYGDGDKNYIYTQNTPSAVWNITHNLDKYPSVTAVNINNVVYYGNVTYVDTDNLTIEFSAGFSGKAYLN